jgi:two-component system sensor histidine kinase DesK
VTKRWDWPEGPRGRDDHPPLTFALLPGAFLFFLLEAVVDVFTTPYSVLVRIAVVVVVVVYAAGYILALYLGPGASHRGRVLIVACLTVFPVVLALMLKADDLTYITYAIVVALALLPPFFGLAYGVTATAALLISTYVADGVPNIRSGLIIAALTAAMFAIRGFSRSEAELHMAREEIKTLAVAEERARVARDLHDVLGHSLTTITLKAGLARRILETSPDVDRAIAEVHDVERLSRQALTEIRSTVSGYRKMSLAGEIAGARAALLAAGIDADLPQAIDDVPGELREPFGYVVREGVTNVIRHSQAGYCRIRLGRSWIEVADDGSHESTVDANGGNGLPGLRERLGKVGGRLTAAPRADGGFLLRAEVTA